MAEPVTTSIKADERRQDERRRDDVALLRYRDVPDAVDQRQGNPAAGGDRPIDERARIELGAKRPVDAENAWPLGENAPQRGVDLRTPTMPLTSGQPLPQCDKALALGPAPCFEFGSLHTAQNNPVMRPSSAKSIVFAAGTRGRPGIVMISPQTATTNSAPAESRSSRTPRT